ncbi:MAG: Thiol-disulfide isomerase-like thioredoxin [Frankiales bacterium]|nr:Thiol-disulfide isomerase-like thioredoxin [Frankiales bacterium]
MSRRQLIGFVVVLALVGLGLFAKSRIDAPKAADLAPLRAAAALGPCPGGLGAGLPALHMACLGGGARVSLRSGGPGTPMLVNMWATWCPPCVREVPVLVDFAARAAGKVGVVGVDSEDESDKALIFAAQYAMHYPSLVDSDGLLLRQYGGGPPITLFVDAAGTVVFTHHGELHSVRELQTLVAQHLGVQL